MSLLNHSRLFDRSLGNNLSAGGLVGMLIVVISISFGSVIFSGELKEFMPTGVGLLLFSSFAVAAIVASFSSYPAIVATPQDSTIPVLALVARHIVETLPPDATGAERFDTVVAAIVLNSFLIATLFFTLGRFKLGGLIRFIPYPVVGGFLAGMGVLLVQSAFHSLNGIDTHHLKWADLLQINVLLQWLPGVIFALLLFLGLQRLRQFWVVPALLGGAIALFYLALFVTGTSLAAAESRGWLLGNFPAGNLFQFTTASALTNANWQVVWKQVPDLAALWLIDTIALLFSASGIELATHHDLDLNHELKVAGAASFAAGVGGGVGGFPLLGETTLAHHLGGTRRIVGWTIAAMCLATILGGATMLSFVPKLIVIGVPIFSGLELLYRWLYQAWFKFSRIDFAVIMLIVWVIATVGYLEGVGVGLIAAVTLFVIDFSRINVIKHELSGVHHHSHVDRSPQQQQLLQKKGDQIHMLELQGFIFFGTANHLLQRTKQLLTTPTTPIKFLLIDFRQVVGLDSSAAVSFVKLKQLATQSDLNLILTHLKPAMQQLLQQAEVVEADGGGVCRSFPDLDRGLEWCETQILEASSWRRSRFMPLPLLLKSLFPDAKQVNAFMPYLEKLPLPAAEVVFQQHDPPTALYFIESGQVSTFVRSSSDQNLRLRTLGAGNVVGEIAFFTRIPYQATAIADQATTLYRLSYESLQTMIQNDAKTAAVFQEFMLTHMAERLGQANEEIKKLLL